MKPIQFVPSNVRGLRQGSKVAGVACLAFMSNLALASPQIGPAEKAQVQSQYGKLPLSFETNQGQADAQVKFLSRGHGYALFLTPTEAVLSLKKPQTQDKASPSPVKASSPSSEHEASGAVLRMHLAGANPAPRILGKEMLPGRVNYLIGKDPGRWHTNVPTYGKVAYEDVYPGVDLVYYGNQGQLEYDFVVAPGADPSKVKLIFRGADKIEINPAGELVLHGASGEVRMHKPVLYQEIDGVRKPVDGGYVLTETQEVSFQIAAYDAAHPLVVDPVLVYSTYLGGSGEGMGVGIEQGFGIAVDERGQAYVTGSTGSANFPTHNALQSFYADNGDAFVSKFTADGAALVFSTYLGGSSSDSGFDIAVDKKGQAYVTGQTFSSDFPTRNALQSTLGGSFDAFVARLSADGGALRYSTYLGASEFEAGRSIAVDKKGQAYVTGETQSSDFPTHNALQSALKGGADAFVTQFTANGRALRYSTYLGGSGGDGADGIAVDELGKAYVTGTTGSTDFPTENALQSTLGGGLDAFVAQLTANGSTLSYSTYLGGRNVENGLGITVDKKGQAYVTGATLSSDFPTENAMQSTLKGISDAFVTKLAVGGSTQHYSTYLGGSGGELGVSIAVDERGQAYVTGNTDSTDFPTENALQSTLGGGFDAFVARLSTDGSALHDSTYLGGNRLDFGHDIAVDKKGQAYVTGDTQSFDFPTKNALQSTLGGSSDAFVAKIGSDGRHCEHGKKCKDDHRNPGDYGGHGKDKHEKHGFKN